MLLVELSLNVKQTVLHIQYNYICISMSRVQCNNSYSIESKKHSSSDLTSTVKQHTVQHTAKYQEPIFAQIVTAEFILEDKRLLTSEKYTVSCIYILVSGGMHKLLTGRRLGGA